MAQGLLGGFDDPRTLGLLGFAAPLLQAGGYSQTPVSFGQALGAGLQGGVHGYQAGQHNQQMNKLRAFQMAEAERAAKDRDARAAAFQRIVSPQPMAPGMNGGPTIQNASMMPQSPAQRMGLDPTQLAMLEALGPEQGMQVLASQAFAKPSEPKVVGEGGALTDARGNVLFQNTRVERPTGLEAEYQAARRDGFKGSMLDYTRAKAQASNVDNTLMPIPDGSSPTGFRYVPRSQALNQPAMGPSGLSIDFGPDGRPKSIMSGPGGGRTNPGNPANLAQGTIGSLEEAASNAGNQLARLDSIAQSFKPEFLQILPRTEAAWASVRERLGGNLTPEQRSQLTEFTAFRRETVANLNQTIKDITGAAMTEAEAGRLSQQVPVSGTGIFDGDSPTEFKAKLDGATKSARNALLRANWARMNGLDPLKTGIELQDVPKLVEKRGAQIESEVRAAMPNAEPVAVLQEVRKRLGAEFGMVR